MTQKKIQKKSLALIVSPIFSTHDPYHIGQEFISTSLSLSLRDFLCKCKYIQIDIDIFFLLHMSGSILYIHYFVFCFYIKLYGFANI